MVIYEESPGSLFVIDKQEAIENGESVYQLKEGKCYEYSLPDEYSLEESEIVRPSKISPTKGRIITNIYVGSLDINVKRENKIVGQVTLEVRSTKTSYRTDYREMLKEITDKCINLLLKQSAPVSQNLTIDVNNDSQTLYQRFSFVDSIIRTEQFQNSIQRINSMPVKRWEIIESQKSMNNIRRVNNSVMRQIATGNNRTALPTHHNLSRKLNSLPDKVNVIDKVETTDIPENRFVKYVLETFLQFCLSIYQHPKAGTRLKRDAKSSVDLLSRQLQLPVFRSVSRLDIIPFHSPVLQKKEGYREVLQTYLMFDMAASLIWKGGDHVYKGGKRDVAALYEYWLFFRLLDLLEEIFKIKPKSINEIVVPTTEGLELDLQLGRHKMIEGTFVAENRQLHIEFYYNRTFTSAQSYPAGGSWTKNMRPDYTLSIWPEGFTQAEAEEKEIIVHIHFDAKYRIEDPKSIFQETDPYEEKMEEAKGYYKRADLLKMHAYKDAIRRTAGAYILYPGAEKQTFQSFHEILPGLGAFAVSPANSANTGLKEFLLDVVQHFLNRASQRELFSHRTFDTFKSSPGPIIKATLPNDNGVELPQTTHVLVAYYKNAEHLEWILKNKLYNARTDFRRGSLKLTSETTSARYILLHGNNSSFANMIFRLSSDGPRVISQEQLNKMEYPSEDIKPFYIGYELKSSESINDEFGNLQWDISKLRKYRSGYNSAIPFTTTLEELLRVSNKVK